MSRRLRLLMIAPGLALTAVIANLIYIQASHTPDLTLSRAERVGAALPLLIPLVLHALVLAAVALLVVETSRSWPRGMPVAVAACVLVSGVILFEAISLIIASDPFDFVVLLILPFVLGVALGPIVGLIVLVHRLAGRTH